MARLRELMTASAVGGAYVTAGPNMYYLCGFSAFERGWPTWLSALLVPLEGDPVLVISTMHFEGFQGAQSWIADVRTYTDGEDPAGLLRGALDDTGLTAARLAVQDDVWYGDLQLLGAVAPACEIVSGAQMYQRLRIVKDADEIKHLRHVGEIMDAGYSVAQKAIRAGRVESEIGLEIARALVDAGSDRLVVNGHFERLTDRRIERGDVIDLDLAETRSHHYEGDSGRVFFVGGLSDEHRRMYELVVDAFDRARGVVAPGVPAQEVHRAAARVIERAGYTQSWKIGHGVGLTIHEPPFVQEGELVTLEPGMVFVIDPGMAVVDPYYTTIRIEDMLVVTDDGYEMLTGFDRDLLIV